MAYIIILVALIIVWFAYRKRRFKVLKHYIEYSYLGDHETTACYGPLDDLTGQGLLKEIKRQGGKIHYHRIGSSKEIHDLILFRETQLAEAGLGKAIDKFYKDNLNY